MPSTYIINFLQALNISEKVLYRGPFRFEIPKASRLRAVKNVEGPLYGIFAWLKNRSIFEDTEFLNDKEREIRTSGLFSRLDSNFEKPEGPTRLAGPFKIKIMFSGKLWLGSVHKIQSNKWTGL